MLLDQALGTKSKMIGHPSDLSVVANTVIKVVTSQTYSECSIWYFSRARPEEPKVAWKFPPVTHVVKCGRRAITLYLHPSSHYYHRPSSTLALALSMSNQPNKSVDDLPPLAPLFQDTLMKLAPSGPHGPRVQLLIERSRCLLKGVKYAF
jgi:hypothetical protein